MVEKYTWRRVSRAWPVALFLNFCQHTSYGTSPIQRDSRKGKGAPESSSLGLSERPSSNLTLHWGRLMELHRWREPLRKLDFLKLQTNPPPSNRDGLWNYKDVSNVPIQRMGSSRLFAGTAERACVLSTLWSYVAIALLTIEFFHHLEHWVYLFALHWTCTRSNSFNSYSDLLIWMPDVDKFQFHFRSSKKSWFS